MRDLLASDDPGAAFAIDHFVYRCGLHAGQLAAALGGLDAFVFTAGIGENAARDPRPHRRAPGLARRRARPGRQRGPGPCVSRRPASRVALLVVPTDEELMIARHTLALVG